jgi:phenylacetate-coenzyme A ligase PaaK-like adenylate-forming protein
MLEPLIRANLARWQSLYDRAPAPARTVLTSARGWLLARIRYAPETFASLRVLRSHESWSASEIASYQLHALRNVLAHARHTVPFYGAWPHVEIDSFDDLRRLPILSRETVRQGQERFLSQTTPPHLRVRAGTTGTTGANLTVSYTEDLARQNWAFLLRQWAWAGLQPRQPRVTFFGARIVPVCRTQPPFWTYNLPERQILMSIFHLSEKTAPAYLAFLRRQTGKILEGFPSVLSLLADFVLLSGKPIPMRVLFTTGEPLYAASRERIEAAFKTRVFDTYGMTEFCGLIQECEHHRMHLAPEYGYLEILDDTGQPVAPGLDGNFVWTGFLNHAMPLIRYRIGDRGRWQGGDPCPCGRAFPLVIPTITRESDILRAADGRLFSPRALNQLLKQSASLRFCQFIHDRAERVVVRGVPSNGRAAEELMHIRAGLQDLLGPAMKVTAELAAAPVSRPGGKIPLIVNQVSQ